MTHLPPSAQARRVLGRAVNGAGTVTSPSTGGAVGAAQLLPPAPDTQLAQLGLTGVRMNTTGISCIRLALCSGGVALGAPVEWGNEMMQALAQVSR